MTELMKFFQARRSAYHTNPRLIDEVLYSSYSYNSAPVDAPSNIKPPPKANSGSPKVADLLGLSRSLEGESALSGPEMDSNNKMKVEKKRRKFDSGGGTNAEVFVFEYGVVVIWGMTESEEKRFLSSM